MQARKNGVDNCFMDEFDPDRFLVAQEGFYDKALSEIRKGRKTGHWMWFIFPQVRGLGHSALAQRYAINFLKEARQYLAHPLLGPRLGNAWRLFRIWTGQRQKRYLG